MLKDLIVTIWQQFTAYKYYKPIVGGVLCAATLAGGYFIYDAITQQRLLRAHKAFTESVDMYKSALSASQQSDALWQEVERSFNEGFSRHKNSWLAPFFVMYEAETLIKQKKLDEAMARIDTLLSMLPYTSIMRPLYATKLALCKLDSADAAVKSSGLAELAALAHDNNNAQRDIALYYLGQYYMVQGDTTKAHEAWHELMAIRTQDETSRSPFAAEIQGRLPA